MEVHLAFDQFLLISLYFSLEVGDGFFLLPALAFELIIFLILQLQDEATLVVNPSLAEEVLLEMLVFVAEVDHVEAEVLVVLLEAGVLLLLQDEVALQGHELHLKVSSRLEGFGQGCVELLHLVQGLLVVGLLFGQFVLGLKDLLAVLVILVL